MAEIAKANVSIYAEEDKIKKAEAELGKLYYRDYAVGEEMDTAEYLPWCQKIDESKQTIADLRDYIDELKAEQVVMEVEEEAGPMRRGSPTYLDARVPQSCSRRGSVWRRVTEEVGRTSYTQNHRSCPSHHTHPHRHT